MALTPFLMFTGQAEEAIRFYAAVFPDAEITPSVSFFFDCADEAELDALFEKLADGGTVLMPPDRYPFARKFAWLNDRYGVSWQLSVGAE